MIISKIALCLTGKETGQCGSGYTHILTLYIYTFITRIHTNIVCTPTRTQMHIEFTLMVTYTPWNRHAVTIAVTHTLSRVHWRGSRPDKLTPEAALACVEMWVISGQAFVFVIKWEGSSGLKQQRGPCRACVGAGVRCLLRLRVSAHCLSCCNSDDIMAHNWQKECLLSSLQTEGGRGA